jgi:hypothetical protein
MTQTLRRWWTFAIVCLTLGAVAVALDQKLHFGDQAIYFLTNYFFLLLAPLCLLASPFLNTNRLGRILLGVGFPLMLLGILQHFLSDPVLPTSSDDGSLTITSWEFYSGIRAFSLFGSGLDFSCFLALLLPLFVSTALLRPRGYPGRLVSVVGIGLSLIATYATLTRAGYLVVIQSVIVGWVLSTRKTIGKIAWFSLPMITAAIAILAIIVVPLAVGNFSSDLLENHSLLERLLHWQDAVDVWTHTRLRVLLTPVTLSTIIS